jgi:hypothetical protein
VGGLYLVVVVWRLEAVLSVSLCALRVVKNSGCGFVRVHLRENTKEPCDWWVLGEVRILAMAGERGG